MYPVVLVTGASSGIGAALVRLLAATRQYQVVATTRQASFATLVELFRTMPQVACYSLDVDRFDTHTEVIKEVHQRFGRIDVLVNNAAISYRAVVEDMSPEEEYQQFAVNYFGPMNLIRAVLPLMRAQRSGKIINVSSVGGMMAMPTMSPYSASKFALEGASEALWYEVRPWNIFVTLVQPGFVRSEAFRKVLLPKKAKQKAQQPYRWEYQAMQRFIDRLMERALATPHSVARVIYRVIRARKPPLRVPATPDAWFFILFRRLLPRRLYHWILYHQLPQWHRQ